MTTLDILRAIRKRLTEPEHWTQGVMAGDVWGDNRDPESRHAVAWCLAGALLREGSDLEEYPAAKEILTRMVGLDSPDHLAELNKDTTIIPLIDFNDDATTTHDDILDLLDAAIAAEEASPSG